MKPLRAILISLGLVVASATASATPFVFDAQASGFIGGTGKGAISLPAGEHFAVAASPIDLREWTHSTAALSDANGDADVLTATALDDSGQAVGIATDDLAGPYSYGGPTVHVSSFVGSLDGGSSHFFRGTSYSGVAVSGRTLGPLQGDNSGSSNSGDITADVNKVIPQPGSLVIIATGLGAVAFIRRRRVDQKSTVRECNADVAVA